MFDLHPLIILGVGVVTVLGMIIVLRVNAFVAMITAAIIVSLLSPGTAGEQISRVAVAFGTTAGKIGIVIALAAVIGRCLIESGAADRIVRAFVRLLGEKRCAVSLMSSGFVLSIPVFFDTVFYLLLPLARSMHRQTKKSYVLLILAMGAGASITHSLVPPTPGPLIIADQLGIDLGVMINIGLLVAAPTAVVMLFFIGWLSRRIEIPMRPLEGGRPEPAPLSDEQLPGLFVSLLPIILPVLMISFHTVAKTLADAEHAARLSASDVEDWRELNGLLAGAADANTPRSAVTRRLGEDLREAMRRSVETETFGPEEQGRLLAGLNKLLTDRDFMEDGAFKRMDLPEEPAAFVSKGPGGMSSAQLEHVNRLLLEHIFGARVRRHIWETPRRRATRITGVVGDANLAMLAAAAVALFVLWRQRGASRNELAKVVETSLMSGGVIILITCAGGAFGAMLKEAQIGPAIRDMFASGAGEQVGGIKLLVMAYFVAFLIKFAQGSSTVSMITTSAMLAPLVGSAEVLGYHPVYLATAIGFGAQCGNWMNDSGFWIFAKMSGLTEVETLKTWTVTVSTLAFVGLGFTIIFAKVLPLV